MQVLLVIFTILFSNHAHSLTIQDALVAAYKNNQELLAERQGVLAAHEAIVQAKKGYRPSIQARGAKSFSASRSKPNSDNISRHTHTQSDSGSLNLSQNIFRGGIDAATVSKTEAEIKLQWARLKDKEQQIFLKVIQAFLDLCVKYANTETYKVNLQSMEKSYEAARDKQAVGEDSSTNASASRSKYAQAQAELEKSNADLQASKALFEQITGLIAPEKIDYPTEIPAVPASLDDLIAIAVDNNPSIIQAKAEYEATKSAKKIYTGQLMPSLDLGVSSSRSINSPKTKVYGNTINNSSTTQVNNQAELSLTIPLYEQGAVRSQRRQASEQIIQKRIAIENTIRAVTQACRQAFPAHLATKINLKHHEVQTTAQSEAVNSISQEVEVGVKVLTDFLIQQTNLLSAKLNRIQNIQAYYNAIYQMLALQGKLTAESMRLPVEYFKPEDDYNNVKNRF